MKEGWHVIQRRGFRRGRGVASTRGSRTAGAAGVDFRGRQVSPWSQWAPSAMTTEDILNSHPSKGAPCIFKRVGTEKRWESLSDFCDMVEKTFSNEGGNWVELEHSFYF